MNIAETERLLLRRLATDDADFILDLYNQPSFIDNIGDRGIKSLGDAKDFIRIIEENYTSLGYWLYLVIDKASGEKLGVNGLIKREALPQPDIGFAFLPQFCRQGFAYESSLAVIEHAKAIGLNQLIAIISPGNTPSEKLLLKMGFEFQKQACLDEQDLVNQYCLSLK